ncbi:hypothetical protein D9Y22_20035 [Methylorubrum sp. DB1722]|jgi:hypothetical protein|nr:hypothetical protein [Methylorubrum sp. DB1722]
MHGRRPATAPETLRNALATRLSREMTEAERHGFGTATVWLTREEADLICEALRMAAGSDAARLDFLDRCTAALTAHDGTVRHWRMSIDQDGVMLDAASAMRRDGFTADGHASCRSAIDERMDELESARSEPAEDWHIRERRPTDRPKRA